MSATEVMKRDYEREQNWRAAQAFGVDASLVDALCSDDDEIDDYSIKEIVIAAGRIIRDEISFEVICDIVNTAYVDVMYGEQEEE